MAAHEPLEMIDNLAEIEIIAVGTAIRELSRLIKNYGAGRWRKMKGKALIRLRDGTVCKAELHWYEAHSIGRKEMKIKRIEW